MPAAVGANGARWVGLNLAVNRYPYVGNDPLNWVDPHGVTGRSTVAESLPSADRRDAFGVIVQQLTALIGLRLLETGSFGSFNSGRNTHPLSGTQYRSKCLPLCGE